MTEHFDGKAFVKNTQELPGVYLMLDEDARPLYVGKARNLKKRLSSYFTRQHGPSRIQVMLAQVRNIRVEITRSEAEALLLENQLIKKHKPRYNILLRDDKSYPYILLSEGDWPRISFHRGSRGQQGEYFGPYPSVHAVRGSLDILQKLFKVRQCEDSVFQNRQRPCLQYQIGRCKAPCTGLVSHEEYEADVKNTRWFLKGKSVTVIEGLIQRMEKASAALDFERAAQLRDDIARLKQVQSRQIIEGLDKDCDFISCAIEASQACIYLANVRGGQFLGGRSFFPSLPADADRGDILASFISQYYSRHPVPAEIITGEKLADASFLQEALSQTRGSRVKLIHAPRKERAEVARQVAENAEKSLQSRLMGKTAYQDRVKALANVLGFKGLPKRLECFDISHTAGESAVASCVVFSQNGPEKKLYRRFNIREITGGDDYAAMRQALERRYSGSLADKEPEPDILLIDGGAGQLSSTMQVMEALGIDTIEVFAIAKGRERIAGQETVISARTGQSFQLDSHSAASHMLQEIRDEAHRFAVSGHRKSRDKSRTMSPLEKIEGIGPKRRTQLLKHFGGLQGLRMAGVEELKTVPGFSQAMAEKVYKALMNNKDTT